MINDERSMINRDQVRRVMFGETFHFALLFS